MTIKSKQGENYELIYTVRHTYHDDKLNLDYSNEGSIETTQLEKIFEYANTFQEAGYKNISIHSEVTKIGESVETWLIQDSVGDIDLKANEAMHQDLNRLGDTLERLEQYDKFLKEYDAHDEFEKFLRENK